MVDEAVKDITEFEALDPTSLHLVGMGANGFDPLLAKARGEVGAVLEDAGDLTKARWAGFCGVEVCEVCKERFGPMHPVLLEKARLKTKQRNALPDSAFALPETREYPIHDLIHAHKALELLHNAAPADQKKIKAAVHSRYPDIEISKEGTPQASREAFSIPPASGSEGQGRENHPGTGAVQMDVTPTGTHVTIPTFTGHPAPSADQEGHGSTAPNKTLPVGEAKTQTQTNTRKAGEGDGRGDPAPGGDADDAAAEREAKTQTDENTRKQTIAALEKTGVISAEEAERLRKDTPGDPDWEAEDVKLAESAGAMIDLLAGREKAEQHSEDADDVEKRRLSPNALKALETLRGALESIPSSSATKEIDDMTQDELLKMLDERDARLAKEKKDRQKAEKEKADAKKAKMKAKAKAKMKADEDEMAEKAKTDPEAATKWAEYQQQKAEKKAAKGAGKASKATADLGAVTKTLDGLATTLGTVQEQVAKMAAQPTATPLLSAAGIAAVGGATALRGQKEGGAFKALEDNVQKALDTGDPSEYANATRELTTARMIAFERARAGGASNDQALALVR
jgi:hypothetical protein